MSTGSVTLPLSALQERFAKSGLKGMSDQEILELLLSLGTPGKNYQKLAQRIINNFKSLKEMLRNHPEQIGRVPGVSNREVLVISVFRDINRKYFVDRLLERPIYETGREIYEYYYQEMIDARSQRFKILCLDKGKMVNEELDLPTIIPDSSIAQSSRVVIEHTIKCGARYFVVVHNHISGDPKPTKADREFTRDLVFAGLIIQIRLLDHVILGKNDFYSFSADGLIDEYEMEYQNLKLRGASQAKRRLYRARTSSQ